MEKKVQHYFLIKNENGNIEYQGAITQMPTKNKNGKGFYFSWADGCESDSFVFCDTFLDKCILFTSDYEMRRYTEIHNRKNKN